MSPIGPHSIPRLPPPRLCPACSCELDGAGLCEVCGAADFHGAGLWICYACGQNNGPREERCRGCRKNHVIACPACGYETFHRDLRCESCGAARALFPAIRRMIVAAAAPVVAAGERRGRHGALSLAIALVALVASGVLGATGRSHEALVCGGTGGVVAMVVGGSRKRRGNPMLN